MLMVRYSNLRRCALVCFTIVACSTIASKVASPPEPHDLVGSWIGFEHDRLYFCRLELEASGKGYFAKMYTDNPALLYIVKSWSLSDRDLAIELLPVDEAAEPIYLKGAASRSEMLLEIGEPSTGWKRELRLFNEKQFMEKRDRTKQRIDKHRLTR